MKPTKHILLSGMLAAAVDGGRRLPPRPSKSPARPARPSATTTIDGKQLPAPDPKFGGVIKDDALQSKPWWAPRIVPPKDAPNVLLIITDDSGLRRAEHLRRRHPDAHDGSPREERPALQQHPLHRALLADARRAHHRPQPSLGRLRRDLRAVHRLPRLQQHHRRGQGDHRPHPQGQRLRHLVVRQGSQHAGLRGQPGRAVRPMADRHGLRVFLRLRRRRREPVAAEPLPQHHPDLSLRGQAGLEPRHRHGRRRDRLPEPHQPDRAEQAVLRANTRPAPRTRRIIRPRNGWTRSTPCTSSTTATKSCASASSRTRRSSA